MLDPFHPHLMPYKRIMLKLSGQSFAGTHGFGIEKESLSRVAKEIAQVVRLHVELAVVVGGGNIWRWRDTQDSGIERTDSDRLGMLATIMNAVALHAELEANGLDARVLSALDVKDLTEPFATSEAIKHLGQKQIVICAGGTGHPYVTTDSAAALRAVELECDVLLKATHVDGAYDADPKDHPSAKKYDRLSIDEAIDRNLGILDAEAFKICKEHGISIVVFDFLKDGNLLRAVQKEPVGTVIS